MEPMTILVTALSLAGLAQPSTDRAVKDAYARLKTLLLTRFGQNNPRLERILENHAEDPDTFKPPLEKILKDFGADCDQEVIDAATELLKHAERSQPGLTGGMVGQINAQGGRVVVIGGDFHGTLNMGPPGDPTTPPPDK
jgi:hypothetical protein